MDDKKRKHDGERYSRTTKWRLLRKAVNKESNTLESLDLSPNIAPYFYTGVAVSGSKPDKVPSSQLEVHKNNEFDPNTLQDYEDNLDWQSPESRPPMHESTLLHQEQEQAGDNGEIPIRPQQLSEKSAQEQVNLLESQTFEEWWETREYNPPDERY